MTTQSPAGPAPAPQPAPRLRYRDLYMEELLTAVALVIVVAAVTWGVVTRYVSHTPAIWTGEVASIAFAWAVFLGSAAGFRRAEHIIIDTFIHWLPAPLARFVTLSSRILVLLILLSMSVISVRFAISTFQASTTVLRLPQSVVYGAAAVGFVLMTLRHLQFMIAGAPKDSSTSAEGAQLL